MFIHKRIHKFVNISIDQENGFVTGYINGLPFTICLEQGKRKQYILAISKNIMRNGSLTGIAGKSNCPFFARFPNSAGVATKMLAKQAKIKLV